MRKQILLDMDGCLVDFTSGALKVLNKEYGKSHTLEDYVVKFGKWNIPEFYGVTDEDMWNCVDAEYNFWFNLQPMDWAKDLYEELSHIGDVTIVTAPSDDPECVKQKYQWLDFYLGIKPPSVFMGHRKYLMAGNGILIDDYIKNVERFRECGGQAILIPSTWNTPNLTLNHILLEILASNV